MSGDPAAHASTSKILDPVSRTEANTEVTPDCLFAVDSDKVSVTNSEVEMNHRRRQAALRDPGFSEEAFNAFSIQVMHTSEMLKMGLLGPQTSI